MLKLHGAAAASSSSAAAAGVQQRVDHGHVRPGAPTAEAALQQHRHSARSAAARAGPMLRSALRQRPQHPCMDGAAAAEAEAGPGSQTSALSGEGAASRLGVQRSDGEASALSKRSPWPGLGPP